MRLALTITADVPDSLSEAEVNEIAAAAFCQVDDARVGDREVPTGDVTMTVTVV